MNLADRPRTDDPGGPRRPPRLRLLPGLLLAVGTACVSSEQPPAGVADAAAAEAYVDRWLTALVSDPTERGFAMLHPTLRTEARQDRYLHALSGLDSSEIEWHVIPGGDHDGSADTDFYLVRVELVGGSANFPDQVFDLMLMQRMLVGRDDEGIVVIVKVDRAGTGIWRPGGQ